MNAPQSRKYPLFWSITGFLTFGMTLGGSGQLIGLRFNADGMRHLGYPLYVMHLLGAWKLAAVVVILAPGWLLAKEWAYAGLFFLLASATVSHLASGDGLAGAAPALMFAVLTVASWYLRPAERRLVSH